MNPVHTIRRLACMLTGLAAALAVAVAAAIVPAVWGLALLVGRVRAARAHRASSLWVPKTYATRRDS